MGNWKSCQRPSAGRGHHHGAKVSFNLPTTIQLYFQFTHNFSGVISIYLLSDSIRAWEIETHMSVGAPMSNTSATQKRVSIYHYIAVRFSIYQRRCPPRYWTTLNGFQFTHHVSHVLKLIEITVFSKCNSHCPVNWNYFALVNWNHEPP